MSERVFRRLTVDVYFSPLVTGKVLVAWALEPDFVQGAPGPFKFRLERGYAANDDNFVPVAETTDQPWAYDNSAVLPQTGLSVFYRVLLTTGDGQEIYSQPASIGTYWSRYDFSLAKEIIRKEELVLRKRAGVQGWLLKRRAFGEACAECTDSVTGEVTQQDCPTCYGTGVTGGYYDPIPYWVILNAGQRVKKLTPEQGLITEAIETVKALAHPRPDGGDVWVHSHTGQRFEIQGDISALARHRGIDLILNLRLKELPRSYPVYKVPLPCLTAKPDTSVEDAWTAPLPVLENIFVYAAALATDPPVIPTSSAEIKALAKSVFRPAKGSTFTISVPGGATIVIFAYPATLQDVSRVFYVEGFNADIKRVFTQTTVEVEGDEGVPAEDYRVYSFIPVEAFAYTVTYNVTI